MDMSSSFEATTELLAILPLLNRIVVTEVRREVGEDASISQFRVLALLAERPLTLSALAKKRRVSPQSMSELVQVLVERSWIVRTPDPSDRRQSLLQLSEHGRLHYERADQQMLRRLAPLMAQLSRDELAAVRMALPALRRVLTQEDDDAKDER